MTSKRARRGKPIQLAVLCAALSTALAVGPALAGEADVVAVSVTAQSGETYRFDVTVRHADEGWEHYADRWDVVGEDGTVFGTRELLHPHVNEQPFERSLSGVEVPAGIASVTVRARDSVHGYGGAEMKVALPER